VTLKDKIIQAAEYLRPRINSSPEIGIVLGTGLGSLGDQVKDAVVLSYSDIPNFPDSTVKFHAGKLICGMLNGTSVIVMQGRFHYYEGYPTRDITLPIRVMHELGVHTLIVSNAAGGIREHLAPGTLTLINDHINLMGMNPLIGPFEDFLGERFPDMSEPYSKDYINTMEQVALAEGIALKRAVYVAVAGPNLESGAEYRFLRAIGADTVGMSTVPENLVAVHGGMKVVALQVITDACFPDNLKPANVQDIIKVANEAQPRLVKLVTGFLAKAEL